MKERFFFFFMAAGFASLLFSADVGFYGGKVRLPEEGDYYFVGYTPTTPDFLEAHYGELEDGRKISIRGKYESFGWVKPYRYQEKLRRIGLDVSDWHLLEIMLRKVHVETPYLLPVALFPIDKPPMEDLRGIEKGDTVVVYGVFRKLPGPEPAIQVHVVERRPKGTNLRFLQYDGRLAPTPTPTPTVTPTPKPSLWQKTVRFFKPLPTPTPTGTWVPPTPQTEEEEEE